MKIKLSIFFVLLFSSCLFSEPILYTLEKSIVIDTYDSGTVSTTSTCDDFGHYPMINYSTPSPAKCQDVFGLSHIFTTNNTMINISSLTYCSGGNGSISFGTSTTHTYKCEAVCSKTCESPKVLNPETCSCEVPPECPSGQVWSNEVGGCDTAPTPECTENELLNENNECVPFDSLMPDDFPNDLDANGQTSTGTVPTTEQGCKDLERYSSSLGMVEVLGWDYQSQTCKVVAFKCNQGRILDKTTNRCIIPPDNANLGAGNICPNDNWARRWTHDFCGQCAGTVGVWFPPLGHEESGMECNKAYIEYQCVKDYRIKKYVEVSCGDPLPSDAETREIDMSNLDETKVNDTNASQLSDISQTDSTLKIAELLEKINTSVKSNSLIGVENKLTELINKSNNYGNIKDYDDKLENIASKIDGTNEKLDSIDGTTKEIKNALDGKDKDGNPDKIAGQDEHFDNIVNVVNTIKDGFVNIESDYNNMKTKIESGFLVNTSLGSKTPLKATVLRAFKIPCQLQSVT